MDIALVAQVMGFSLFIICAAALIRPQLMLKAMNDVDHESFSSLVTGFLLVVFGLLLVLTVSVWEWSWRGLLTLMGWGTLIKGIMYLVAPQHLITTARMVLSSGVVIRGWMVGGALVGLYLAAKGMGW